MRYYPRAKSSISPVQRRRNASKSTSHPTKLYLLPPSALSQRIIVDRPSRDRARLSRKLSIKPLSQFRLLVRRMSPSQILSKAFDPPKGQEVRTALDEVYPQSRKKKQILTPIWTLPDQTLNPAFHCLILMSIGPSEYLLINAF